MLGDTDPYKHAIYINYYVLLYNIDIDKGTIYSIICPCYWSLLGTLPLIIWHIWHVSLMRCHVLVLAAMSYSKENATWPITHKHTYIYIYIYGCVRSTELSLAGSNGPTVRPKRLQSKFEISELVVSVWWGIDILYIDSLNISTNQHLCPTQTFLDTSMSVSKRKNACGKALQP